MGLEALKEACRTLDDAPEACAILAYLESFASVPEVAAMKRHAFELLRLQPGAKVLDVGCGLGQDVAALADLVGPDGAAVGIDPSTKALAAGLRAGLRCVVGRAEALPFADSSFDAARSERVLEHLERPQQAVREMARVTRPGGRIVLSEGRLWIAGAGGAGAAIPHGLIGPPPHDGETWIGPFLPSLLMRAGLRDIATEEDEARIHDFETIRRCLGMGFVAAPADSEEARRVSRWMAVLAEDVAAGRRWLALRMTHTIGIKPAAAP